MKNIEENGIKEKYVAVADCTGHGVPGAIMSMICSSTLSKALLEEVLRNTGEILDRTREIVIESMAKAEKMCMMVWILAFAGYSCLITST